MTTHNRRETLIMAVIVAFLSLIVLAQLMTGWPTVPPAVPSFNGTALPTVTATATVRR